MKRLMQIISAVFHPLLMESYVVLVLYKINPALFSPIPRDAVLYFIFAIFIATAFIPALSLAFLRSVKIIQSLELTIRKERILPFILISCLYTFSAYTFEKKLPLPDLILAPMIASPVLIVLLSLISLRFKISVHAAASTGVLGTLTGIFYLIPVANSALILVGVALLTGLTSTSRLYLGRHNLKEIFYGAAVGFSIPFLSILILG
ncbi:MAG: hypothetical protein ABJ004_11115 [Cyclobacteriaceae bacterium]